ncbi:MAG: hypothetical protein JOZ41_17625 [Chloroflexi bacterium]|nr:hypothetical protein [Chloroflexota bacterium]
MEKPRAFQVGDAVLADLNGARVPGVIEDKREGEAFVRLAQPWTDERGRQSTEAWVPFDRLDVYVNQETGGSQALPG